MSVAGVLCPVHHQLVIVRRDEYPACLQCEIDRLREWLEGIRDYATRHLHGTRPATLSLADIRIATGQALSGVAEDYQYRDRPEEITPTTTGEHSS